MTEKYVLARQEGKHRLDFITPAGGYTDDWFDAKHYDDLFAAIAAKQALNDPVDIRPMSLSDAMAMQNYYKEQRG